MLKEKGKGFTWTFCLKEKYQQKGSVEFSEPDRQSKEQVKSDHGRVCKSFNLRRYQKNVEDCKEVKIKLDNDLDLIGGLNEPCILK